MHYTAHRHYGYSLQCGHYTAGSGGGSGWSLGAQQHRCHLMPCAQLLGFCTVGHGHAMCLCWLTSIGTGAWCASALDAPQTPRRMAYILLWVCCVVCGAACAASWVFVWRGVWGRGGGGCAGTLKQHMCVGGCSYENYTDRRWVMVIQDRWCLRYTGPEVREDDRFLVRLRPSELQ